MTSVHAVHTAHTVYALLTATATATALVASLLATPPLHAQTAGAPLALTSAKVSLAGTSNVHDYTASTSAVRLTRVVLGQTQPGAVSWDEVQSSAGLVGFDVTIAAGTLTCPRDGVDKNMHKALKVEQHPTITFSLERLDGAPGALTATGLLRIAGVARAVTLPLTTVVSGDTLAVTGALDVQMPDYGIKPPTALLGAVRASPKVRVTFDLVLARTAN